MIDIDAIKVVIQRCLIGASCSDLLLKEANNQLKTVEEKLVSNIELLEKILSVAEKHSGTIIVTNKIRDFQKGIF